MPSIMWLALVIPGLLALFLLTFINSGKEDDITIFKPKK